MRPRKTLKLPAGQPRMIGPAEVEEKRRDDASKPATADVLHYFGHRAKRKKGSTQFGIRLTDPKERALWSEMRRPWRRRQQDKGQRANAAEKKVMFKKPNGKRAYVFESMAEEIEKKTGMRAARRHRPTSTTVYRNEGGRFHAIEYDNIPGKGFVCVRHDQFDYDKRTGKMNTEPVKTWRRRGR